MPAASPTDADRGGVLVVGSVSADLTTFSSRLPGPGETFLGEAFTLVLGGKGANQAIAAGRAGAPTRFVGCVGDDLFAPLVREGLEASGVDISRLRTVPGQTGIAHIRVDASGENDIVVVPLANAALDAGQVDEAIAAFAPSSRVLLTQLEIPRDLALHALARAQEAGLVVVLDPAPAQRLPGELWERIDVVTPNETEASILTGIDVRDRASAERAARWFLERGVGAAIVTLAGAGTVLAIGDDLVHLPPYPVQVRDTTAAGDAFAGYLAAHLAAGEEITEAIAHASAAGALAVTVRGASPSIPLAADVEALRARGHGPAGTPAEEVAGDGAPHPHG